MVYPPTGDGLAWPLALHDLKATNAHSGRLDPQGAKSAHCRRLLLEGGLLSTS